MIIRVPMDHDLYDAAMDVMDAIENKLTRANRKVTDEEVLGRDLALAYRRWQTLLICRYAGSDASPPEIAPEAPKLDGRRHNRPAAPPKKNHPWRGRAKLPKT